MVLVPASDVLESKIKSRLGDLRLVTGLCGFSI